MNKKVAIFIIIISLGFFVPYNSFLIPKEFQNSSVQESLKEFDEEKIVNTSSLVIDGKNNSLYINSNLLFNAPSKKITKITVLNAPGTIIEDQTFDGVNISIIDSPYSLIRNNQIGNLSEITKTFGIYIKNSPHSRIENNLLTNISSGLDAFGIYGSGSQNLTIQNNIISEILSNNLSSLTVYSAFGIYLYQSPDSILNNNTISKISVLGDYDLGGGIHLSSSTNIQVQNNTVQDIFTNGNSDAYGIFIENSPMVNFSFNLVKNIQIQGSGSYPLVDLRAVYILSSDDVTFFNNTVKNIYGNVPYVPAVYGLYIEDSNATLIDQSLIRDIYSYAGSSYSFAYTMGIYIFVSSNVQVLKSNIVNVTAFGNYAAYGYGIFSDRSPSSSIELSQISEITALNDEFASSNGITILASQNSNLINNSVSVVKSSSYSRGISVLSSQNSVIENITIDTIESTYVYLNPTVAIGISLSDFDYSTLLNVNVKNVFSHSSSTLVTAKSVAIDIKNAFSSILSKVFIENIYSKDNVLGVFAINTQDTVFSNFSINSLFCDSMDLNGFKIEDSINLNIYNNTLTKFNSSIGLERGFTLKNITNFDLINNTVINTYGKLFFEAIFLKSSFDVLIKHNRFFNLSFWLNADETSDVMYFPENYLDNSIVWIYNILRPQDQIYQLFASNELISWTVYAPNPKTYEVYYNGSIYSSNNWSSGQPVSINLSSLSVGYHNFTAVFTTFSNNKISDTAFITILPDQMSPIIISPANMTLEQNFGIISLIWNVSDQSPLNYSLLVNNVLNTTGNWISYQNIFFSMSSEVVGLYNVTLVVQDKSNNTQTSTVFITIYPDVDLPQIVNSGNVTTTYGVDEVIIFWILSDTNPDNYTIYLDEFYQESDTWISGQSIDYTFYPSSPGLFNLTIVVLDVYGNIHNNSILITVLPDLISPVITAPVNRTLELNSGIISLNWNVSDQFSTNYFIYVNNIFNISGNWISNQNITFFMNTNVVDFYNITLIVQDKSNNTQRSEIFINIVNDLTLPQILSFGDLTIEVRNEEFNISWVLIDLNPDTYILYLNSVILLSDTWVSDQEIVYSFDPINEGIFNLTIVVYDAFGNYAINSIFVDVKPDMTYPIVSHPNDINLTTDTTEILLNWSIYDLNPNNYSIFVNTTSVFNGTWTNYENVSYLLTDIDIGLYLVYIIVFDESGHLGIDLIMIYVEQADSSPTYTTTTSSTQSSSSTLISSLQSSSETMYLSTSTNSSSANGFLIFLTVIPLLFLVLKRKKYGK